METIIDVVIININTNIITSSKEVMLSLELVCLFVSKITQKLLREFYQISRERWHVGYGRNCLILGVIQILLC